MRQLCALLLLLLSAVSASAGVATVQPAENGEERVTPEEANLQRFLDRIAGLDAPLFDATDIASSECGPDYKPQTRGLFIAASRMIEDERFWLQGPENDAELFRNTLILRGAQPDNLVILQEDGATHAGLARAARELTEATGCGDSVILHFSGFSFDASLIGLPDGDEGPFSSASKSVFLKELTGNTFRTGVADRIVAGGPFAVLNIHEPGHGDVLSAAALSELVTLIRNRGADVVVVLDTASASTFAIEARQAQIDPRLFPRISLTGRSCSEGVAPQARCTADADWPATLLSGRAGELTVFYSTTRGDAGVERKFPVDNPVKVYGFLSFQLATAMAGSERTTVGALARRIAGQVEEERRSQSYNFVSSDPDLDVIAEGRPDRPLQKGEIIIDTPETNRAARKITTPKITIAGRVSARGKPTLVEVNGKAATLTSERGFQVEVPLQAGVNTVELFAVTDENEAITRRFELFYEGDIRAVIGEGKRYAVLIANQDYADGSGIPDLSTPVGDAEALARVLTERYGFSTEAPLPDGDTLNLFLRNASQRETGLVFDRLARIAGERDSVLVFYAGHGEYEERGTAYWLPADALAGAYSTFVDAGDITRSLNRIAARNVLVISDSCYSGMLLRGQTMEEPPSNEDRLLALQRLAEKRSRVVISSGGNEPVLDGGAGGHSVFADALLRTLNDPGQNAFSARELFATVLSRVTSAAEQTPDFRPIHGAGHEGGDFVFLEAEH